MSIVSQIAPIFNERQIGETFWSWLEEQLTTIMQELEEKAHTQLVDLDHAALAAVAGIQTLKTFAYPNATLRAEPKSLLKINVFGTAAANTNNKQLQLWFGATLVAESPVFNSADNIAWEMSALVGTHDEAVQHVTGKVYVQPNIMSVKIAHPAEDVYNNGVDIIVKGESGASAADDLVVHGMTIELLRQGTV